MIHRIKGCSVSYEHQTFVSIVNVTGVCVCVRELYGFILNLRGFFCEFHYKNVICFVFLTFIGPCIVLLVE